MSLFDIKSSNRSLELLQYIFFGALLLYWGRPLFIPFSLGLLISFILYPIFTWFERHKISRGFSIVLSLTMFFLLSLLVIGLLVHQFIEFMQQWPALKVKLNALISSMDARISGSWMKALVDQDEGLLGSAIDYVSLHILPGIPRVLYSSSVSLVLFILIPIYAALILYYREVLVAFLYKILPEKSHENLKSVLPRVIKTYYNFIQGMGMVYLIVGILNSLGLFLIGIPNPIFFGFVASILTFIPYVGITVGAILPMAISWLHFDSALYPLGVVGVFAVVQLLEANVIFPLAVSQNLKINALITLIVIIAGGIVWGAMGMILFIPFLAILKLIADQVEDMKAIAILLGTKKDLK